MRRCKHCGSIRLIKHGAYTNTRAVYQNRKCKNCGRTQIDGRPIKLLSVTQTKKVKR